MTVANIECAVLSGAPQWIGTRGPDRFANATELPLHEVKLPSPVAVACDPVTEGAWASFAPAKAVSQGELPVVAVSWQEASAYCAWLGERTGHPWRLPSESEWEIACRAGSDAPFAGGFALTPEEANYWYDESGGRVGPGGRTVPGRYPANAWGLRDLHGNVSEWCADAWHPSHEGAAPDGAPRFGAPEALRVIRGGSWDLLPRLLRCAQRDALPPGTRRDNVGFRLALTLPL